MTVKRNAKPKGFGRKRSKADDSVGGGQDAKRGKPAGGGHAAKGRADKTTTGKARTPSKAGDRRGGGGSAAAKKTKRR